MENTLVRRFVVAAMLAGAISYALTCGIAHALESYVPAPVFGST